MKNTQTIFSTQRMDHADFKAKIHKLFEAQEGLIHSKNSKYAKTDDALSNFRFQALTGLICRMNDKMNRLITMHDQDRMEEDSFEDAFRDIANYGIIAQIVLAELKNIFKSRLSETARTKGEMKSQK